MRLRSGYSSARAFHRAWRGRGVGACSYKAYCEIEAGRLVPAPALAARLASALSVRPGTRQADAYRNAYLFSATRSRSLARTLAQSLRPESGSPGLAERALSIGRARRRHVLTRAQKRLVVERPAARLSLIALHARYGPWTPASLASVLGLSSSAARAALRRLAAAGLVKGRRGAYTCPLADRDIVFPRPTQSELEKMGRSFFSGFPSGAWSRQQVVLFRATGDGARRLARQAGRMATDAHALHRRSGEGGIFSVGAFVWRVS
jgi:DNA-binding MarR family transcriptional regulator